MTRALALVALAWASVAHAEPPRLAVQPHLGVLDKHGFVVAFETATDTVATVEIAHAEGASGWGAFGRAAESSGQRHAVRVSGLAARARVRWQIVAGGVVLGDGEAETAPPDDATALDFLVYGDTRSGEADERAIAILGASGTALFALHTGDLLPTGDDEEAWVRLFEVEQPLLARVPLYLAVGNHELYRDTDAQHVRRYVPLPESEGGTYYTFRLGPARMIVLDSSRPDEAQTTWLAGVLADAAREAGHPHVFVAMHHPPFSTGGHCGSAVEEAAWVELFERFRPTAVFAGHDHAYERLERNGIRYFVSGGGGAPLYAERERCPEHDRAARRVYRAEHHLLWVRLRGEAIEVEVARPNQPPIEVVRWSRGDATSPPGVPAIIDERKPTGLFRPLVTTIAVAALVGLLVLVARRRRA